jgi:hypothetical protein
MKELKCERCQYEWVQKFESEPQTCPSCRSPYWKKPLTPYWKAMKEKKNNDKR